MYISHSYSAITSIRNLLQSDSMRRINSPMYIRPHFMLASATCDPLLNTLQLYQEQIALEWTARWSSSEIDHLGGQSVINELWMIRGNVLLGSDTSTKKGEGPLQWCRKAHVGVSEAKGEQKSELQNWLMFTQDDWFNWMIAIIKSLLLTHIHLYLIVSLQTCMCTYTYTNTHLSVRPAQGTVCLEPVPDSTGHKTGHTLDICRETLSPWVNWWEIFRER